MFRDHPTKHSMSPSAAKRCVGKRSISESHDGLLCPFLQKQGPRRPRRATTVRQPLQIDSVTRSAAASPGSMRRKGIQIIIRFQLSEKESRFRLLSLTNGLSGRKSEGGRHSQPEPWALNTTSRKMQNHEVSHSSVNEAKVQSSKASSAASRREEAGLVQSGT